MTALKLIEIGTSTGIILPKDLLTLMRVEEGDHLYAVETPNGILLTFHDPAVQEQLKLGEKMLDKHRDIFKALAK